MKIKEGVYEQPKHMSQSVKDLLSLILKFNPEERLKIHKIRQHDFCMQYGSQPNVRGIFPGEKIKIEDGVVHSMN